MAIQIDHVGRTQNDNSGNTLTTGVANPGSSIGVRVIIDDTIVTTEQDALLALKGIQNEIQRRTWPLT